MQTIDKVKIYLGINDDKENSLLELLIDAAEASFKEATNQPTAADYQHIITKMVVEDYNRIGSEGIASLAFGAGSETALQDYSEGLQKQIRRAKKVKVL